MPNSTRFSKGVKKELANRVGHRCSNPGCRRATVGPTPGLRNFKVVGDAAHIHGNRPRGPRYSETQTEAERQGFDNGVWLCPSCHRLVDGDISGRDYSVEVLQEWKREAERAALREAEEPRTHTTVRRLAVPGGTLGQAAVRELVRQGLSREPDAPSTPEAFQPWPASFRRIVDEFIGRAWLEDKLDSLIAENESGVILIEGPPGFGKTAFSAKLVSNRGLLHHFFADQARGFPALIANLCYQLAVSWQLPSSYVPNPAYSSWVHLENALTAAAARRLRHHPDQPIVMVLDGLDSSDSGELSEFMPLIRNLPSRVYIVVTTQPHSGVALHNLVATIALKPQGAANRQDLSTFVRDRTRSPQIQEHLAEKKIAIQGFTEAVLDVSKGIWIYAKMILDEVEIGAREPTDLETVPGDLWSYYSEALPRLVRHAGLSASEAATLLATLASVSEGINSASLSDLSELPLQRTRDLLAGLATFLVNDQATLGFYHQSFRDFIVGIPPSRNLSRGEEQIRKRNRLEFSRAGSRLADRSLQRLLGLLSKTEKISEHQPDILRLLSRTSNGLAIAGRFSELGSLLSYESRVHSPNNPLSFKRRDPDCLYWSLPHTLRHEARLPRATRLEGFLAFGLALFRRLRGLTQAALLGSARPFLLETLSLRKLPAEESNFLRRLRDALYLRTQMHEEDLSTIFPLEVRLRLHEATRVSALSHLKSSAIESAVREGSRDTNWALFAASNLASPEEQAVSFACISRITPEESDFCLQQAEHLAAGIESAEIASRTYQRVIKTIGGKRSFIKNCFSRLEDLEGDWKKVIVLSELTPYLDKTTAASALAIADGLTVPQARGHALGLLKNLVPPERFEESIMKISSDALSTLKEIAAITTIMEAVEGSVDQESQIPSATTPLANDTDPGASPTTASQDSRWLRGYLRREFAKVISLQSAVSTLVQSLAIPGNETHQRVKDLSLTIRWPWAQLRSLIAHRTDSQEIVSKSLSLLSERFTFRADTDREVIEILASELRSFETHGLNATWLPKGLRTEGSSAFWEGFLPQGWISGPHIRGGFTLGRHSAVWEDRISTWPELVIRDILGLNPQWAALDLLFTLPRENLPREKLWETIQSLESEPLRLVALVEFARKDQPRADTRVWENILEFEDSPAKAWGLSLVLSTLPQTSLERGVQVVEGLAELLEDKQESWRLLANMVKDTQGSTRKRLVNTALRMSKQVPVRSETSNARKRLGLPGSTKVISTTQSIQDRNDVMPFLACFSRQLSSDIERFLIPNESEIYFKRVKSYRNLVLSSIFLASSKSSSEAESSSVTILRLLPKAGINATLPTENIDLYLGCAASSLNDSSIKSLLSSEEPALWRRRLILEMCGRVNSSALGTIIRHLNDELISEFNEDEPESFWLPSRAVHRLLARDRDLRNRIEMLSEASLLDDPTPGMRRRLAALGLGFERHEIDHLMDLAMAESAPTARASALIQLLPTADENQTDRILDELAGIRSFPIDLGYGLKASIPIGSDNLDDRWEHVADLTDRLSDEIKAAFVEVDFEKIGFLQLHVARKIHQDVYRASTLLRIIDRAPLVDIPHITDLWSNFSDASTGRCILHRIALRLVELPKKTAADCLRELLEHSTRLGRADLIGNLAAMTPLLRHICGEEGTRDIASASLDLLKWYP